MTQGKADDGELERAIYLVIMQNLNRADVVLPGALRLIEPVEKTIKQIMSLLERRDKEARIDELLFLTNHADPFVLDRVWIQNRIAELSQLRNPGGGKGSE